MNTEMRSFGTLYKYKLLKGMGCGHFTDKTVHRHAFRRQFTARIDDSSLTDLKTVQRQILYCIMDYRWYGKSLIVPIWNVPIDDTINNNLI